MSSNSQPYSHPPVYSQPSGQPFVDVDALWEFIHGQPSQHHSTMTRAMHALGFTLGERYSQISWARAFPNGVTVYLAQNDEHAPIWIDEHDCSMAAWDARGKPLEEYDGSARECVDIALQWADKYSRP